MKVICIEEEAFFQLVEKTIERLNQDKVPSPAKWIGEAEAMNILHIKSKTTLQRLRDEGKIRFSQPIHKVILYDRESLIGFIEDHVHETF